MSATTAVQKVPILMYHSISSTDNVKFKPFTVSPTSFAQQMEYLYQQGYTPITVTQLVQSRTAQRPALPAHPVVLTFDDGFTDFLTNAIPILQHYRFTATLYVPTAFVGQTSRWLRKEKETTRPVLTWEQLRQVQQLGIECGGHTHSHPRLDTLSPAQAQAEIVRCKEILEQHLEQPVTSFAYPFGSYTARVRQFVQEAGYISACTVKHAMSDEHTDPLALTRFQVKPETSLETFGRLLKGTGISPAQAYYLRTRTSVWQALRQSSTLVTRHFQGRTRAI